MGRRADVGVRFVEPAPRWRRCPTGAGGAKVNDMALRKQRKKAASLTVPSDRPLIGILVEEENQEVTRYFMDDAGTDAAVAAEAAARARALAGAWSDLNWEEMVDELDRIRHDTPPTPPIDEL